MATLEARNEIYPILKNHINNAKSPKNGFFVIHRWPNSKKLYLKIKFAPPSKFVLLDFICPGNVLFVLPLSCTIQHNLHGAFNFEFSIVLGIKCLLRQFRPVGGIQRFISGN